MTRSEGWHRARRLAAPVLGAACLLLSWTSGPIGCQSTDEIVAQRELAYRAARDAFEAVRSAYDAYSGEFNNALTAVDRALRSGDADAIEAARAAAFDRSQPLQAQSLRVEDAAGVLDAARESLMQAITVRLQELVTEMAGAARPERDRLDAIFRDLRLRLESLQAEAREEPVLDPVVLPQINFDPRDGDVELRAKAEVLELRAALADTLIRHYDRQIADLRARQRVDRDRGNLLAGLRRFGDTEVPVVPVRPPGGSQRVPVVPGDSAAARASELTLEQRIESLLRARAQTEAYRDQALLRAERFRRRLRSITG